MPELKRVVVASQERLGYGENFAEALSDLLEGPSARGVVRGDYRTAGDGSRGGTRRSTRWVRR